MSYIDTPIHSAPGPEVDLALILSIAVFTVAMAWLIHQIVKEVKTHRTWEARMGLAMRKHRRGRQALSRCYARVHQDRHR